MTKSAILDRLNKIKVKAYILGTKIGTSPFNTLFILVIKNILMTLRAQLIKKILTKIDQVPDSKLRQLLELLDSDVTLDENKKAILGFAGSWKDWDKETMDAWTTNLHNNRMKNQRAINE